MNMLFGRHKGRPLDELPAAYVVWLSRLDDLRDPLRGAVVVELGRRVLDRPSVPARPVPVAVAGPEIHLGTLDQDGQELPF